MKAPDIRAPRSPRYRSLDVWRGLACLMVVVYHSTYYAQAAAGHDLLSRVFVSLASWLYVGVPMFFVISGYCIAATADSARRKQVCFREYMIRRVRRIFPPYWILTAISLIVVLTGEGLVPGLFYDSIHPIRNPRSLSFWQWFGTASLTESWRHHFDSAGVSWIGGGLFMGHAWTLCYEEQFYLVVGMALLVSRTRFFTTMSLISLSVFATTHVAFSLRLGHHIQGFFFDGSWQMFAAGILVHYQRNYADRRTFFVFNGLLALAAIYSKWIFPSIHAGLFPALVFAGMLICMHHWDSWTAETRLLRPLASCGTMCYSLYLVHWPIVKLISHALSMAKLDSPAATIVITVPICGLASLTCARAFHQLVERHFLNAPSPAIEGRRADQPAIVRDMSAPEEFATQYERKSKAA